MLFAMLTELRNPLQQLCILIYDLDRLYLLLSLLHSRSTALIRVFLADHEIQVHTDVEMH